MKEYLDALEQSLTKKLSLLDAILEKSKEQEQLLGQTDLAPDVFEQNVNEKAALIEELERYDKGFDEVYARIRKEIDQNREKYRTEIGRLQDLIRKITARSASIRSTEARNKELAQRKFTTIRKQIRDSRSSAEAVNRYYQSMTRMNVVDPQFMDDKH